MLVEIKEAPEVAANAEERPKTDREKYERRIADMHSCLNSIELVAAGAELQHMSFAALDAVRDALRRKDEEIAALRSAISSLVNESAMSRALRIKHMQNNWESEKRQSKKLLECKCGDLMVVDRSEELTSFPPKYRVTCPSCGEAKHVFCHDIDRIR